MRTRKRCGRSVLGCIGELFPSANTRHRNHRISFAETCLAMQGDTLRIRKLKSFTFRDERGAANRAIRSTPRVLRAEARDAANA